MKYNLRLIFVFLILFSLAIPFIAQSESASKKEVTIGSKRFPESYLLGEIAAQLLETNGYKVNRKFGMGGTMVAYTALVEGGIDLYADYTGTISLVIFKEKGELDYTEINKRAEDLPYAMLEPLGFNNTYAIAVAPHVDSNIKKISDLANHPEIRGAFFNEFTERPDGYKGLQSVYKLKNPFVNMDHALAYEALKNQKADMMDAYTTDSKIKAFNLRLLIDDKEFFPKYLAAYLVRKDADPKIAELLSQISGTLNNESMLALNEQVEVQKKSFSEVANGFLKNQGLLKSDVQVVGRFDWAKFWLRTYQHLYLTFVAIIFAVLIAVPLGIILVRMKKLAAPVLMFAGLLQTIPSIALLTFMIPFFGIGVKPAIMGLLLYSILPILRNTYTAIDTIDSNLLLSARAIGLYSKETLFQVELPMALPVIITGIRTAAVINVGTATLAAFIGGGGLGEPIVTGLALNDVSIILQGAIPSAILAILVDLAFNLVEKRVNQTYGY